MSWARCFAQNGRADLDRAAFVEPGALSLGQDCGSNVGAGSSLPNEAMRQPGDAAPTLCLRGEFLPR
jgi:hypothetical protein